MRAIPDSEEIENSKNQSRTRFDRGGRILRAVASSGSQNDSFFNFKNEAFCTFGRRGGRRKIILEGIWIVLRRFPDFTDFPRFIEVFPYFFDEF